MWKKLCGSFQFAEEEEDEEEALISQCQGVLETVDEDDDKSSANDAGADQEPQWFKTRRRTDRKQKSVLPNLPFPHPSNFLKPGFSYRQYFKQSYSTSKSFHSNVYCSH